MIEVSPNLWVGNGDDEASVRGKDGWTVVSAARDPWHRRALGYTGRGAPKDHPEYLIASRPGHLILNLVDAADVAYIPQSLVEQALRLIHEMIDGRQFDRDGRLQDFIGNKVLIHCNQGQSRSPTIALLYLARHDPRFAGLGYDDAIAKFKTIYPPYEPSKGMADYARLHWKAEVAA